MQPIYTSPVDNNISFDLSHYNIVINGDIMIKFKNNGYYRHLKMFRIAFNTSFIDKKYFYYNKAVLMQLIVKEFIIIFYNSSSNYKMFLIKVKLYMN